jgi:osmotically inducible protein OsmC
MLCLYQIAIPFQFDQPHLSLAMSSQKAIGHSTWTGTWKEGTGTISTSTSTLQPTPYTFSSRFHGTPGASPEELLAAAQAGCFNQALANNFGMTGFEAESISTSVTVELGYGGNGFPKILAVTVDTQAKVGGLSEERFQYCVERARTHCTIAVLMNIELGMKAALL